MLNELHIQNFRLFSKLHIDGLKRVNLFAGKNNCGKTTILDALRILSAGKDLSVISHIITHRGQNTIDFYKPFDGLFNIQALEKTTDGNFLELKINDFLFSRIIQNEKNLEYLAFINGVPYHHADLITLRTNGNLPNPLIPRDTAVFVPFNSDYYFPLQSLWDDIVLTPKEDDVYEILKSSILPDLIRLDVKPERTLARLKGLNKPLPLKSLGDGAQRMLLIAIALVSAKDKLLLMDEIEAGLHHSVMEKLWEIIFKYAEKLNVQVFATTHSSDAIKTFTYTLEQPGNGDKGAYFRMQHNRKTDEIEVVPYGKEDLELSLEANLETR